MGWIEFNRHKPPGCKKERKRHYTPTMDVAVPLTLVLLFLFYPLLFPSTCLANELNHHVIVLIDRSASMKKGENGKAIQQISSLIKDKMREIVFTKGEVVPGRRLLDEDKNDYLSTVSFGLPKACPDFRNFIKPIRIHKAAPYRYRHDFQIAKTDFSDVWQAIQTYTKDNGPYFRSHWSAISMAIPSALYYLRDKEAKFCANRTFIVMVTDEAYNNLHGYPVEELNYLKKQDCSDKGTCFRGIDYAQECYEKIQTRYTWKECKSVSPQKAGRHFLRVFEVLPLTRNFAIESLISYEDARVWLDPVEGGYRGSITINARHAIDDETIEQVSDEFDITAIEFSIVDQNGKEVGARLKEEINGHYISKSLKFTCKNDTLRNCIENTDHRDPFFLRLRFWVRWKDKAYGLQELNPDAPVEYGSPGLERLIPIQIDPPAVNRASLWNWDSGNNTLKIGRHRPYDDLASLWNLNDSASESAFTISYIYNQDGKRVEKRMIDRPNKINTLLVLAAISALLFATVFVLQQFLTPQNSNYQHTRVP